MSVLGRIASCHHRAYVNSGPAAAKSDEQLFFLDKRDEDESAVGVLLLFSWLY